MRKGESERPASLLVMMRIICIPSLNLLVDPTSNWKLWGWELGWGGME